MNLDCKPRDIVARPRPVERLGAAILAAFLCLWAPQSLAQRSQAVLPDILEPDLCRLVAPEETAGAASERLAGLLLHSLPGGRERLIRWPDTAVIKVRYQDHIAFNDNHLPRNDFVRLLIDFARALPIAIDGQDGLPVGEANFRYIRKDYAYQDPADFAAKRAAHLAQFAQLAYFDYDAQVEARFFGETACAGMIAYDDGYRGVAGAAAVRLAFNVEAMGERLWGPVPPYTGMRHFPHNAFSTAEEHGQCLMHALQWSLGVPHGSSEDTRLDLAALLYAPALKPGMSRAEARRAIALTLGQKGCVEAGD